MPPRQSKASEAGRAKLAMRVAYATTITLIAAGCATSANRAPLPTRLNLVALSPSPERIAIVDMRPDETRKTRVIEANGVYSYLADESVEPPPVALLSSSLAGALPEAFRASTIELTRLDIGFWTVDSTAMQSNVPIYIIQGAPTGANIVGNLLGQSIAYAIRAALRPGVKEAAIANIEFRIGPYAISTIEVVAIQGTVVATQAVETAVSRALKNISEKVDAMKYWDQKQVVQ